MKKQWKPWLYVAAVLCMSVSCKKEECICANCGAPDQKMTYRTTIQNARADVGFAGLIVESIKDHELIVYYQQPPLNVKLQQTYDFNTGKPQPFKYRVWGKIYNCDSCPTAVIGDVLHIRIDKIETVN